MPARCRIGQAVMQNETNTIPLLGSETNTYENVHIVYEFLQATYQSTSLFGINASLIGWTPDVITTDDQKFKTILLIAVVDAFRYVERYSLLDSKKYPKK